MSQEIMRSTVVPIIYLVSTVLFIFGIKQLSKVKTARRGNTLAAVGMLLAIIGALLELGKVDYRTPRTSRRPLERANEFVFVLEKRA